MDQNKKIILLVIGIVVLLCVCVASLIGLFTALTFVAVDPAKNFSDTRNSQRWSDVTQILNAITQYTSDGGQSLETLTLGTRTIPTCGATEPFNSMFIGPSGVDLSELIPNYLVSIPMDPQPLDTSENTGYMICATSNERVRITAPYTENMSASKSMISVLR